MYRIVHGSTHDLPDVTEFIETLDTLGQSPHPSLREIFVAGAELFVARAPGRLDVMGGIADYSGSLVLEKPILEATLVALQRDRERTLKIASLSEDPNRVLTFEMPLADFERDGEPLDYEVARAYFRHNPASRWAAYVAGVFLVLMRERRVNFREGARILISSRVPSGKGVSSSAALEVATMQAVAAAFGVEVGPREMAVLCQAVENLVVGAPCGVMDQMTSVCGEADRLLALLCQPAEPQRMIEIDGEVSLWGLDSGVRHAVTGAAYGTVRVGTFMGYRIIADVAGLKVSGGERGGTVRIDDPRWGGYLANLTPSEFEQTYAAHLPERISGDEFIARYQGTTDPVTRVEPERIYAVRVPGAHAVYEHHRVRCFAELLRGVLNEGRLKLLGELMYQSHASYSACGLGSEGTDRLVELVRAAGTAQGLYGAKITGGGSGGTVAVLGRHDAGTSIVKLAESYARETGHRPHIFAHSSPGSASFGHIILRPT